MLLHFLDKTQNFIEQEIVSVNYSRNVSVNYSRNVKINYIRNVVTYKCTNS